MKMMMLFIKEYHLFHPPWEENSSDEESEDEVDHPFPGKLELPPNMDAPFEWEAPDLKEGGEWC
jgi:hypothetical protein